MRNLMLALGGLVVAVYANTTEEDNQWDIEGDTDWDFFNSVFDEEMCQVYAEGEPYSFVPYTGKSNECYVWNMGVWCRNDCVELFSCPICPTIHECTKQEKN